MTRRSGPPVDVTPLHITLPNELADWLRHESSRRYISRTSLIIQLVAAERDRTAVPQQLNLIGSQANDSRR